MNRIQGWMALGLVITFSAMLSAAPQVKTGTPGSMNGDSVDLPIVFTADSSRPVSTMQFDVTLPKGVTSKSVEAGEAAKQASKNASSAMVKDKLRVIVFGINQTVISSGVIATLKLQTTASAQAKIPDVKLTQIVFSDPAGKQVR